MSSSLFFAGFLIALSVFGWNALPHRIAQDVAEWEMTPQQGRGFVFMYRSWCVAFAIVGVVLTILTLLDK